MRISHGCFAPAWQSWFAIGVLIVGVASWTACQRPAKFDAETIQIIVRTILDQQVTDWNDGQIDRFMRGYSQAASTRFASGADVSVGWQEVMERYRKKYPNKAAMGRLTFSQIDVSVLSSDAAVAFGRWRLERGPDQLSGLFTLIFRKTHDGWRIVHDHTSTAAKE
jgi:ketosteroid isomerase-like protein